MDLTCKKGHLHFGDVLIALLIVFLLESFALADDWSLMDNKRVRYSLSGLHGKWVLVNFWAPWCSPCIHEMPELASMQKQHKDLQVIGVAVMYSTQNEVMDMVKSQSISYPIVLGNEDTPGDFGGIVGLPTSLLYSPTGALVSRYEGPLTKHKVEQAMALK